MKNEIVKIDPKEYGLEESKVEGIVLAFQPKIAERDGLAVIYSELITKELTPELSVEAGTLRKKLVKVRTGIAEIHKTQKAFFLAAGRYVDAWKNKETLPIEQMEEKLTEIEKHAEIIEKQRIDNLQKERDAMLLPYNYNTNGINTGLMSDDVWNNFISGVKLAHEQKIEAEKKSEAERIEKEKAEAAERERIRKENERLKKEAEEKEKALAAERAKAEAERKAAEAKLAAERKAAEAKLKAEKEKAEKERKIAEEKARIEREKIEAEKAKVEAELKAKADAERKAAEAKAAEEKKRIAEEKKAAAAPDKAKLKELANIISNFTLPEMKTIEGMAVIDNVKILLNKTANYINEQTKGL